MDSSKASEQLISLDVQNSTTNYKSTYSIEIVPICKDDLICLPRKMAASLSNIGQLVLCHRVGNAVHLLDPQTLATAEIPASIYWRSPFPALATASHASTEFIVLDIEPAHHPPKTTHRGRYMLADAQVAPASGSLDPDAIYTVRTHLGSVLKPGDTCLGFHLGSANFNNAEWDELVGSGGARAERVPEVVLVRKTYPERQRKRKPRNWRLKSIVKTAGGEDVTDAEHAGLGRAKADPNARTSGRGMAPGGAAEQARAEAQYEMFLRDLEEDEEMRAGVTLYKAPGKARDPDAMDVESDAGATTDADDDEDDLPRISVDELVDELAETTLGDSHDA